MKSNLSAAAKMIGISIFACAISFFVYISLFVLMRGIATDVAGYTIYEIDENGAKHDVETVSTVPESIKENQGYYENRTSMPNSATVTLGVIQVICGVGVYFCTTGTVLAKEAAKDRNNADFNGAPSDKLRGLKIGALAAVPSFAVYICIMIMRFLPPSKVSDWFFWIYRWIVLCPVKPIVDLMTGSASKLSAAPVWAVSALIVFSLLLVAFSYTMYLICYNEDSFLAKVLYKSAKKTDNSRRLGRR